MAHDGDWTRVADYAKAAKACGVDVLKLQCHLPEESSDLEQWRPGTEPASGETRLQYWTRTAWDVATWRKVGQIIHAHGLQFGCSVFCLEAVALLKQVPELDVWKVPSGVSEWDDLRETVEREGRPVWVSTGLSDDSSRWLAWVPHYGDDERAHVVNMNCTSAYPCQPELSGLGHLRETLWHGIDEIQYGHKLWGWSDHTGDPALIYAAIGAGATVVEVHFELGHEQTPDSAASWNEPKLAELVRGIRRIEQGLASTDKDAIAAAVAHLRKFYVPTRLNGRIAKHNGEGDPI